VAASFISDSKWRNFVSFIVVVTTFVLPAPADSRHREQASFMKLPTLALDDIEQRS
jgi:hypothetical protein